MLQKVQKYLLQNYPLIWNIKLLPVLLISIPANIFLFILGYTINTIDFRDNDTLSSNYGLFYFLLFILIVVFIILWLVNYAKNNALKSYYPVKASTLYMEWVLSFVIVFSICLLPYSFDRGTNIRIRSYTTLNETKHAIDILDKVQILMPKQDYLSFFYQKYPSDEIQQAAEGQVDQDYDYYGYGIDSIFIESKSVYYSDYPNFRHFSLLNYHRDSYYSSLDIDESYIPAYIEVKSWLVEGKSDSIKSLMASYLDLEKVNNFNSKLTVDSWFNRIYNYPTFELNESMFIEQPNSYFTYTATNTSLAREHLSVGYQRVLRAYNDDGQPLLLWMLYLSLAVSVLTFAYRVTAGKTWLIAMVVLGLLTLVISFVCSMFFLLNLVSNSFVESGTVFVSFLLLIIIVEFIILSNSRVKGKTGILLNHIIGFGPLVPLLLLYIISMSLSYDGRDFVEEHLSSFLYINLIISFASMYLLSRFIIIRWKGLPEE